MHVRPLLDDVALPLVQRIAVDERQMTVSHDVPGRDVGVLQRLNRGATRTVVEGVAAGPTAADDVARLRALFQAAEPVAFVADVMTATDVRQVLIDSLEVDDVAGHPLRFAYRLTLREHVAPPRAPTGVETTTDAAEQQRTIEAAIEGGVGTLEVTVIGADGGGAIGRIAVLVTGQTADGEEFSQTIREHADGLFRADDLPPGDFDVSLILE